MGGDSGSNGENMLHKSNHAKLMRKMIRNANSPKVKETHSLYRFCFVCFNLTSFITLLGISG